MTSGCLHIFTFHPSTSSTLRVAKFVLDFFHVFSCTSLYLEDSCSSLYCPYRRIFFLLYLYLQLNNVSLEIFCSSSYPQIKQRTVCWRGWGWSRLWLCHLWVYLCRCMQLQRSLFVWDQRVKFSVFPYSPPPCFLRQGLTGASSSFITLGWPRTGLSLPIRCNHV